MYPSELQIGDRIITTMANTHGSCPANVEGIVWSLAPCIHDSNSFQARMEHSGSICCISYSGAKVLRRLSI